MLLICKVRLEVISKTVSNVILIGAKRSEESMRKYIRMDHSLR